MPEERINKNLVSRGILLFTVLVSWGAILLNAPVLSFTSICSPIFGLIGCLIPAYLVYRVPELHKYKGLTLKIIIATGILLLISPFLAFS
jgi:amino acid permease